MKSTKPTQAQIDQAIEKLAALKKSIPQYSHFGDNNWKAFDLQTKVLKGELHEPEIYSYGDSMASQLLDVIEWKKGLGSDWFKDLMDEEV